MQRPQTDEFFVGYLPQIPPATKRIVRLAVVVLFSLGAVIALIVASGQRRLGASFFEFGTTREFTGIIRETPYPFLEVVRPGESNGLPNVSRYVLVGEGKHGANPVVTGLEGQTVTLKGTLINRDDQTMIEVVAGSVASKAGAPKQPQTLKEEELGTVTLRGEIVDSKCHLGVMNPGEGKVHRSCAVRCISGGAPPVLFVRDAFGNSRYLYLVSSEGRAVNREVLETVGEPVEITGRATRLGNTLFLYTDPRFFRRL